MKLTVAMIAAIVLACALSGTALAVPGAKRARHAQAAAMLMPAWEPLQNELQGDEGIVDDGPISCWDCPHPDEPVALFVAGLIMLALVMILVRLARTRRNHAEIVKRILGH